ncbi:MAG: thiamine pyrophosphate-dependent enzyme, partial [Candidatus Diapherotrites archaeon]|nr:thiamine pyrophosphate-dependent enzyme [Candidatus Diapherotrites archaeon]
VERARNGGGPTLIETITYRMGDHTTADDAKKYRPQEELEYWVKRDPIDRLRKFMALKGIQSEEESQKVWDECVAKVEDAVKLYEQFPKPNPTDMFDYIYEELPDQMKEDRDYFEQLMKEKGEQ